MLWLSALYCGGFADGSAGPAPHREGVSCKDYEHEGSRDRILAALPRTPAPRGNRRIALLMTEDEKVKRTHHVLCKLDERQE